MKVNFGEYFLFVERSYVLLTYSTIGFNVYHNNLNMDKISIDISESWFGNFNVLEL